MPDPVAEKPERRPRYPGLNPRRFRDKYKEHRPDRYAADVAKVLDAGKTPAGSHRPIMVREVIEALRPAPGMVALDCTLGHAGHARELLAALLPGGKLLGIDADPIERPRAEAALLAAGFPGESFVTGGLNFAGIVPFVAQHAPGGVDLILADLGLSSMQVDDPARGFTYKVDGPLDMRMNPRKGRTAAEVLAGLSPEGLARLLAENADEPRPEALADALCRARARAPIRSTTALAEVVRATYHKLGIEADDAVRRVFQALRIAVNDELASLEVLLRSIPACLKPGGRVAILSFHSGEDRRVKRAFQAGLLDETYAVIADDITRPSAEERRANPRCTAAKLRYAVRSSH